MRNRLFLVIILNKILLQGVTVGAYIQALSSVQVMVSSGY